MCAPGSWTRAWSAWTWASPRFEAPLGGELLEREHTIGGEAARISFVSMGNPHCVVTGLPVTEARARRLGPLVEHDPLFPARTNVQFLEVLNQGEIRIEILGAGGGTTPSPPAAPAAPPPRWPAGLGRVGDDVTVHMPGGRLQIHFRRRATSSSRAQWRRPSKAPSPRN